MKRQSALAMVNQTNTVSSLSSLGICLITEDIFDVIV